MNQYLLIIAAGEVETYKLTGGGDWSECQFGGEGLWSIDSPEAVASFWKALWGDERLSEDDEIGCLLLSEDKQQLSLLKAPEGRRTAPGSWKESELRRLFEDQWRIFDKFVLDETKKSISLGKKKYYYAGMPAAVIVRDKKQEEKKPGLPPPPPSIPEQAVKPPVDRNMGKIARVVHPPERHKPEPTAKLPVPKQPEDKANATAEDIRKVLNRLGEGVTDTVKA